MIYARPERHNAQLVHRPRVGRRFSRFDAHVNACASSSKRVSKAWNDSAAGSAQAFVGKCPAGCGLEIAFEGRCLSLIRESNVGHQAPWLELGSMDRLPCIMSIERSSAASPT